MTSVAIPRTAARRGFMRPDVSWLALAVWLRNRDVYRNLWRSEFIWPVVEPLVTLIALGIGLGDFIDLDTGQSYVEYIGPGLLAVFPMWSAASETAWGSFFRMEGQRTFDAIISTPASIDDVTSGEILWAATRAVITTVYVGLMVLAFGGIESPWALLVLPVAILPGLCFGAISLCYCALVKSVSQLNYFFAVYITPQFWLAGVFFPLEQQPEWLQVVAWFTPAYHAVEIYRGLCAGDWDMAYAGHIAWLTVFAAVFYAVALVLMRRRLVK